MAHYKEKITMKDIAHHLQISTVAVSKALSDKEGVSDSLRAEVKKVASEMGYKTRVEKREKEVKKGQTYNIGVFVAQRYINIGCSFYWMMYQNLIQHLSQKGYYALLEVITKEDEKSCTVPNILKDQRVDALIILGQIKKEYIDFIMEQNTPTLFLDFYDTHFDMDAIVSDNMYGAYVITDYLISQGHSEIAYVGDIYATSSILDRYLGYYKAMMENNLELRKEWNIIDRDSEGEYCEFILPEEMPTAFICNCDEVAYYLIQHLNKQGIKVPEDVSVVGFDDYLHATLSSPRITTIQVDVETMAKEAARAIIKKIENHQYHLGRKVIQGKLVIRDSTKKIY